MKLSLFNIIGLIGSVISVPQSSAQANKLVFMYAELEPYVIVENDHAGGFIAEYLNTLLKETNIKVIWEHVHWDRQLPLIKTTKASLCAVAIFETNERKSYMRFSDPIGYDEGLVLVGRKGDAKLLSHKTFEAVVHDESLSPILQKNSVYSPYVNNLLKDRDIQTTDSSIMRISRTILSGKHDYMINTAPSAESASNDEGLAIYGHYSDLEGQIPYFIGCSLHTDATLFDRLNKAIIETGPAQP